jgi:hypothetical protein
MVGTLVNTLDTTGEANNTLIVYVSDNGYLWGDNHLDAKLTPYTNSVHVPMFMRWPDEIAPSTENRFAANIDLAPTALSAARLPLPTTPPMDGRNLLDSSWTRNRLLFEYWYDPPVDTVNGLPPYFYPPGGTPHTRPVPTWASLRTPASGSQFASRHFQYVEYLDDPATFDGVDTGFKEYYKLGTDAPEMTNSPSEVPTSPAADNVPNRLALDRNCAGQTGPAACP